MKTTKKALLLALCAVLLVVSTVFATLAYLTDSDTVTNTFTYGKVGISLDEAKVDVDGAVTAGADRESTEGRVQANTYKLMPGHEYTKDPTIHVDSDSEICWVFVKLENGLKDIIDATTIEDQMKADGKWSLIDEIKGIWAYKTTVAGGAHVPVFDSFKLKDDAVVSAYGDKKIVITAYAVQKDGFGTAQAAWDATFGA